MKSSFTQFSSDFIFILLLSFNYINDVASSQCSSIMDVDGEKCTYDDVAKSMERDEVMELCQSLGVNLLSVLNSSNDENENELSYDDFKDDEFYAAASICVGLQKEMTDLMLEDPDALMKMEQEMMEENPEAMIEAVSDVLKSDPALVGELVDSFGNINLTFTFLHQSIHVVAALQPL